MRGGVRHVVRTHDEHHVGGFAGIDNDLYLSPTTSMLFGDAKASLTRLVAEVSQL